MRKSFFVTVMLVLPAISIWAQGWERGRITTPPYGTEKVQKLIKGIKEIDGDDGDESIAALSVREYNDLSFREKFTYNMIKGETYSQNCDGWPLDPRQDTRIYGQLESPFGEYHWRKRQLDFFDQYRDSVIALIRESIGRTGRLGVNYKMVLVRLQATEMIPLLISTYNLKKKDHDILTVLMQMMRDGKYAPFLSSASYQKLYAGDINSVYDAYLTYNTANEELIIKRATDFYNGLQH